MKARRTGIALGLLAFSRLPSGTGGRSASPLPGPASTATGTRACGRNRPSRSRRPRRPPLPRTFELVGMAQFDGVSYVSLIEKQSGEHFILASDKPVRNLKLVSIARGPAVPSAIVQRNGVRFTLQEQDAPPAARDAGTMNHPASGNGPDSQSRRGRSGSGQSVPPRARFHHSSRPVPPPPRTEIFSAMQTNHLQSTISLHPWLKHLLLFLALVALTGDGQAAAQVLRPRCHRDDASSSGGFSNFQNTPISSILDTYEQLSGKHLVRDINVAGLPPDHAQRHRREQGANFSG